mmetsp:Transcript_8891/g.16413  ORF Transcript_8891/g.16413 Transcript_8891/m.16413 type:complete len:209 (-) Transcript_8891:504-1130(-)
MVRPLVPHAAAPPDRARSHPRAQRRHAVEVRLAVGTGRHPHSGALDSHPVDPVGEERLAPKEELVVVPAAVESGREAGEAVEIQLALEGRELRLLEVLGHDDLHELLRLVDDDWYNEEAEERESGSPKSRYIRTCGHRTTNANAPAIPLWPENEPQWGWPKNRRQQNSSRNRPQCYFRQRDHFKPEANKARHQNIITSAFQPDLKSWL